MFQELLSLTIFGSFIWFCIVTGLLFLAYVISDALEAGVIAVLATVSYLVVNYYSGNVPIVKVFTLSNILIYLALGFLYASLRTYLYGVEKRKNYPNKYDFDKSEIKSSVIRWWLLFPFSLISWCVTDLFNNFFSALYNLFSKFFEAVFILGYKGVKK